MPKVRSKAQAGLFGLIAGGKLKLKKFSRAKARDALRGKKVGKLPARIGHGRSRSAAHRAITKAGGVFKTGRKRKRRR